MAALSKGKLIFQVAPSNSLADSLWAASPVLLSQKQADDDHWQLSVVHPHWAQADGSICNTGMDSRVID